MERQINQSENLQDTEREYRLKYRGSKDWFFCPESSVREQINVLEGQFRQIEMPAFGVNVFTDSDRLCEQINQFNGFSQSDRSVVDSKRLFYITDRSNVPPLPNPLNGVGLVEMSSEPADVLCDPSSGLYVINCWDRFTSMESLVLGVRSFDNLREDKLGMHAALIEKDGQGYILMGKPKTGKTTIALSLAAQGFKLISDDWVEVEKRDGEFLASGINPSISLDQQTLSLLQSQYEQYHDVESLGFSSYGKQIMPINSVNNAWNPKQQIPVRKVFILDNNSDDSELVDGEYFSDLLKITDPHTPFMNIPDGSGVRTVSGVSDEIRYGVQHITDSQDKRQCLAKEFVISGQHGVQKFRNKDYTLEEAIAHIINQI